MCDYVPTVFHSGSTCHGFWMFEVKTRRCLYFGNKSTTATGAWKSWGFSGVGCMSLQFSNVYGSFLKVGTPQNGWFPSMHVKCCIHIIVWINMHVCGCMCIYICIYQNMHTLHELTQQSVYAHFDSTISDDLGVAWFSETADMVSSSDQNPVTPNEVWKFLESTVSSSVLAAEMRVL